MAMASTVLIQQKTQVLGPSYLIALIILLICTYANAQAKRSTDELTSSGVLPRALAASNAFSVSENVTLESRFHRLRSLTRCTFSA